MIISATASSIRSALAEARRVVNIKLDTSRLQIQSGGEDGLYRCHLQDGTIVECTIIQHGQSQAHIVEGVV